MFYIFKFGAFAPIKSDDLCHKLNDLQIEAIAEIGPIIRSDNSESSFDVKLKSALSEARKSAEYMYLQKEMFNVKNQLKGRGCPAPTLAQMARLAADNG